MNNLDSVYVFVRAVEAGTFSAAARELRVTPSAVSKQVAKLEDRLGVMLLNRTSRKLGLTDAGIEFYRSCSQSLASIERAEETLYQFRNEARGTLRVAVPQGFGRLRIAPLIPQFLALHPGIRIDLLFGRLSGHLIDERIDVLISSADPSDSNLIVRPLLPIERVACAAPPYLERQGTPAKIDELTRHNCLIFTNSDSLDHEWVFRTRTGHRRVRVSGNFQTNNHEALYVAVLSGLGIAHIPTYVVDPALKSGELIAVFSDLRDSSRGAGMATMNAYFPKAKNRLPKVNVFIDFLIKHFHGGAGDGTNLKQRRPMPSSAQEAFE